jgi:Flp pilus assembly protein TadD/peroxiredoxin
MREKNPILLVFLLVPLALTPASAAAPSPSAPTLYYRPHFRNPPSLEPILRHLSPGEDAFPEEKIAEEVAERLARLSRLLREKPAQIGGSLDWLLATDFKGGSLTPAEEVAVGSSNSFEVARGKGTTPPVGDRALFGQQLAALVAGLSEVTTAEFLVTAIEPERGGTPSVRTDVRYDLVGTGPGAWRAERVGRFRMVWRRGEDGAWRVSEWTASDQVKSRAPHPVFTEVTETSFGQIPSFTSQLASGLDAWLATLDSVFMLDSMGHHGVSVGDADGDGLDDLYVSQPAGLPNRLYRNRGDGSFEDWTERSGLGVLDDTAQSLFADIDNDGDQDLILVTRAGLLLFLNDGQGRFSVVRDAFRSKDGLRGSPISIAMADYDRDGFLDVYLCTYSYFIGAGEDKGGSPNPYHDARNGPPNVLFHNDGHGHFVDVTKDVGLDENNDRFSFAAAWADYDEDGWPDLLVANDFGRKNLYHNQGMKDGKVSFKDVTAAAGVLDHGAGMSAAFLDYDGDGHLDIYTGNMWSAAGQRITSEPGFMPDAPADVRELYRRHARGNSLFRNRGDGTFEDVTLAAGAALGRWAWSSDSLDFDNDGSPDLYVANGMFTRPGRGKDDSPDLDGFFWRQVVARSPLTRVAGTPYEDAWRAINRALADGSQANHQRNVFLRNDGHGRFDDVSGSVGLDLDQDGRSFAVFDYDQDGDADIAVMAARSAPQLRLFRNDLGTKMASLAVRLTGKSDCPAEPKARPAEAAGSRCAGASSNRDAVGARVTVEADGVRRTKLVSAGSGFISEHSKELLFGLGPSPKRVAVTIDWPSGFHQTLADVLPNQRLRVTEGGEARTEAFRTPPPAPAKAEPSKVVPPPSASWLYEPFPAPDFTLPGPGGEKRSLASLRGRPALLAFWSPSSAASLAMVRDLAGQQAALVQAGAGVLAVALDTPLDGAKVRTVAGTLKSLPVALGNEEVGGIYTLLNRNLFVTKDDLSLPTAFLLNGQGEIVKAYRGDLPTAEVVADLAKLAATSKERLARSMAFEGTFYGIPGQRNYLQYGLELVEQGFDNAALVPFERAAKGDPSAFTLYSLGTLYMRGGQSAKAQAAFTRALEVKPDFSEASNGLGALLAQGGNLPAAVARFKIALETTPDYPDALNNLGYALLQMGRNREAFDLYQKALKLQPDFPEAFNNLGIYYAREGDPPRAEASFKQAVQKRPGYGEAGNNLALVLMAREDVVGATSVLQGLLRDAPDFEMTYVTLAKIYASTDRKRDAVQVLERLLQRNPKNPLALQMVRELRPPQ